MISYSTRNNEPFTLTSEPTRTVFLYMPLMPFVNAMHVTRSGHSVSHSFSPLTLHSCRMAGLRGDVVACSAGAGRDGSAQAWRTRGEREIGERALDDQKKKKEKKKDDQKKEKKKKKK